MSQAVLTSNKHQNVWWGLGAAAESQSIVLGVNATLVRMFSLGGHDDCVIRLTGVQVGPGLGGGSDLTLMIATGITNRSDFLLLSVDDGWSFSLREIISANDTPKACAELAHLIKTVPLSEIVNFVRNPSHLLKLGGAVVDFYDNVVTLGIDAMTATRHLWTFPLVGVGFQLSLTYHCANRIELVSA